MALGPEGSHHGNNPFGILFGGLGRHGNHGDEQRNVLTLTVLLLGDMQSGRSSVGNALIGGDEFQTGLCTAGVPVTTEHKLLRGNFPKSFRRKGAESDLQLRVIDTPPLRPKPRPLPVRALCPEGVHVIVLVVRADLMHQDTQMMERVQTLFGPEWRRHSLLVITHADRLSGAGLNLTQAPHWLRALAEGLGGGTYFIENSCDWSTVRGKPLREKLLCLSASNHHTALKIDG